MARFYCSVISASFLHRFWISIIIQTYSGCVRSSRKNYGWSKCCHPIFRCGQSVSVFREQDTLICAYVHILRLTPYLWCSSLSGKRKENHGRTVANELNGTASHCALFLIKALKKGSQVFATTVPLFLYFWEWGLKRHTRMLAVNLSPKNFSIRCAFRENKVQYCSPDTNFPAARIYLHHQCDSNNTCERFLQEGRKITFWHWFNAHDFAKSGAITILWRKLSSSWV